MALHLITGYIGTEHVTADNAGHFNAQLVGEDSFVFGSGKKFEFNINSNNEIRVYDGQGCVNGRHFEMPSGTYEDLPISNGAQNMERNDLIVARYSIDPDTGIESISLAVIEGEPSSSTPSDPAYNGGSVLENAPTVDFPLYRVKIVGLSIESVDTLFSTKVNLQKQISTLDTKVSELNLKMEERYTKKETDDKFTQNNTSWNQTTGNSIIDFQKNGKNVIASIRVTNDIANGATLTGAVPINLRPKTQQVATQIAYHPTLSRFGRVSVCIHANGAITVGCVDVNAQFSGVEWCVLYTV